MSDLSNLKIDADVVEDKDVIGGGFQPLETDIYPMKIDLAYMGKSSGGATSVNLVFKNDGRELKQTLWVTSGDKKGNLPYYTDREGNKRALPGMSVANAICMLTIGKELADLDTESRTIDLYDFDARKEVATKVDVLTDLLDEDILLGVQKQIVDRNVKDDNGMYVPSGETREENEVVKVFRASDRKTLTEAKAGADPDFIDKWVNKFRGVTINKAKGAAKGSSAPTPGAPKAATDSLF